MRTRHFAITFIAAATFAGVPFAFAHAQTPAVQKAFEEVKTKLDDLVSAKDEGFADDLALRIQAMRKVIDFSAEETHDLKIKLLATDWDGSNADVLATWKKARETELNAALAYYDEAAATLTATTTPIDLAGVKDLATQFKTWRDETFIPLDDEVQNFLLVAQQDEALGVARTRLSKIQGDVKKLERARIKGVETLSVLLAKAERLIEEAGKSYDLAASTFEKAMVPPEPFAETLSTSTEPLPTSTRLFAPSDESTSTASSSIADAAETALAPTVRDEVRSSLEGLKDAYRTFIEMSVEAKKILK